GQKQKALLGNRRPCSGTEGPAQKQKALLRSEDIGSVAEVHMQRVRDAVVLRRVAVAEERLEVLRRADHAGRDRDRNARVSLRVDLERADARASGAEQQCPAL